MSTRYSMRRVTVPVTIDVSEDADVGTSDPVALNGLLRGIISTAPDLDDTDTYTVALKDADGNTIYTAAALAEDSSVTAFKDADDMPLALPLSGQHTVVVTASGDQAADREFSVVLLVDRG